jgi:hypothetical protein
MNQIVAIGGFFTGPEAVERAAKGANEELGGDGVLRSLTFGYARRNLSEVSRLAQGNTVVGMSAGNVLLGAAIDGGAATIVAVSGPEPTPPATLVGRGFQRQVEYGVRGFLPGEPDRAGHRAVAGDTFREVVRHPQHYFPALGKVGRFSTVRALESAADAGIETIRTVATDDHMFPNSHHVTPNNPSVITVEHVGGHDFVLRRPHALFAMVQAERRK